MMRPISTELAAALIYKQFPEFKDLPIKPVDIQGHDNRTFRLGSQLLIRMPTEKSYALKVPKEQELLPLLAPHLSIAIPTPIGLGEPSKLYPFHFSIYKWLDGQSANSIPIDEEIMENIAHDLALFLKELHQIDSSFGPSPGLHNWWRGDHISVYDSQAREQIAQCADLINSPKSLKLWNNAMYTKWDQLPVWVHGDIWTGNILIKNKRIAGIIDFGGLGVGDPACDLVITWTLLKGKSRAIFKKALQLDEKTWLRAKAWALWKATFELCNIQEKRSDVALQQINIITEVLHDDYMSI